jgi:hypothetical protein
MNRLPESRAARNIPGGRMAKFCMDRGDFFSIVPPKASTWLGMIVTLVGLGEAIHALLASFSLVAVVPGWTSLTVLVSIPRWRHAGEHRCAWRIRRKLYEQTKSRPLYLVSQTGQCRFHSEIDAKTRSQAV